MGWILVWSTLIFEYLFWLTSFWMEFVLSVRTLHSCTLGFVVVPHDTKIRFEHKHDLNMD